MAILAHLTDIHLLEDDYSKRGLAARARLSYLNIGRPLDPAARTARARQALAAARSSGSDHLVITGDLTEDGTEQQFELFAELLLESRLSPDRVTLVPGNHDAYGDLGAWQRALAGPLRPFAKASALGAVVPLGDVNIVPVSTACRHHPVISAGSIEASELSAISAIAGDPGLRARPLVFAQHHPPQRFRVPMVQWIDGLRDHGALSKLFAENPHLYVLHGHVHRATSKSIGAGEPARVFSAKAVVEGDASLRLYEASASGLFPIAQTIVPETAGQTPLVIGSRP